MSSSTEDLVQKQIRAYDQKAKKILSIKGILAYVLKECVTEFKGMEYKAITKCIGKTQISKVIVDQNMPLAEAKRVQSLGEEHSNLNDAYIRYDLLFYVTVSTTKERIKLYINLEAQRRIPSAYPLLRRANVYVANGIAMQKGVEYENSDYGNVKKCYSIWICMEAPEDMTSINRYHFAEEQVLGSHVANVSDYDLQTMVVIYLGDDHKASPMTELLWNLFKSDISTPELVQKLENEFAIQLTKSQEKELNTMCNLGGRRL